MTDPDLVQNAVRTLATGLVCGFLAVVLSMSLGSLLFFGDLREFVPLALGMALFTTIVVAAIAAVTSPIRGVVSIAEEIPIVALAGPAAAIAAAMSGLAPKADIAATIVVAAALSTLVTGGVLLALGFYRLGGLIRFVPFPVIAGFLAGTGWLLMQGGLSVIAGEFIGAGSLDLLLDQGVALKCGLGVAFAALVALLQGRSRNPLVFPLTLLLALVAYNLVVTIMAIPAETLRSTGWVLPVPASSLWPPVHPSDLSRVDWHAILGTAAMLPGIVIVTVMAILMNATGIELDTGHDLDLDQELRSVGWQNLAAGAGGGLPGYPAVSLSLLSARLGASSRATGLIVAAVTACVLLLGRIVLDFVPTPLLGSLLVWIGAALTYQWLILSVRRLPLWEYLIVVLIFLVIVLVSFTTGIFVGLVAAVILFVVEYGRIDGIRLVLTGRDYQSTFEASEERRERLRLRGSAILIVRLQGFLFFGSSDRLRKNIQERLNGETRFLLIDFKHVTGIDSSAVASFVRLSQLAARGGFTVVLTAMNDTVSRALLRGGLVAGQALRIDRDLDHGLVWCENELLAEETGAGEPRGLTDLAFGIVGDRALASQLGEYFEPASLEPGEFLVEGGLPSDDMFFVGSGRGAVIIAGTANVPVRVATVGPGAIVGEIAFFLDRPRNASVVVETPMTAWRLSRAGLARLQRERPDLAFRFHEGIAAMMAARITSTNRLVVFLAD